MTALANALKEAGYRPAHERLEEIARAALTDHPRSLDAARDTVMREASKDAALLVALFERWQRPAIDLLLNTVAAKLREASKAKIDLGATSRPEPSTTPPPTTGGFTAPGPSPTDREAARADVVRVLSKLDTFLINRRPIGDCTPEQAYEWADSQTVQARYARMLASNLPPGIPIRRSITPAEANQLWERALQEGRND